MRVFVPVPLDEQSLCAVFYAGDFRIPHVNVSRVLTFPGAIFLICPDMQLISISTLLNQAIMLAVQIIRFFIARPIDMTT